MRDAEAIFIAPSNPIGSIGPILAVPGVREALRERKAPRVAVSPIIGGRSLQPPAGEMMSGMGYSVDVAGVARVYAGLVDALIIDHADADERRRGRGRRRARSRRGDGHARRCLAARAGVGGARRGGCEALGLRFQFQGECFAYHAVMAMIGAPMRWFSQLDIASQAAALSFGSNAVLMVAKITVGVIFGSVAVLGDGVDSAQDVLASALALFTVRYAIQPADEVHPYGHGKAESLAALSQAALIFGGAVFITVTAIYRLATGGVEIHVAPSLAMIGITAVVNLAGRGVRDPRGEDQRLGGDRVGRAAPDDERRAGGRRDRSAGAGRRDGQRAFDPIVALMLAAYLTWIASRILRAALSELIDTALPDEDVALLEECLAHEGHGVRGYHALRTRKSGRERYIDMHVLIDPALTVSEAHHRVEEIEQHLREAIPGAIASIHLDPDEPGIMERGADGAAAPAAELRLHRH